MGNPKTSKGLAANKIRSRTKIRDVSRFPVQSAFVEIENYVFSMDARHALMVSLGRTIINDSDSVLTQLEDLATSYLAWRQQPKPSREIARKQLTELAIIAQQAAAGRPREKADATSLVASLDDMAETCLRGSLAAIGQWPVGTVLQDWLAISPDWELVSAAASHATLRMKGGDYADLDLHFCTSSLIDLFEWATGKMSTIARSNSDPSQLCQFGYCFMEYVDPSLEQRTIFNSLDMEQKARRRKARNQTVNDKRYLPIFPTGF